MSLKDQFGKDILLTGWGHSKFGKLTDETLESLIVQVAGEAISNSGLDPKDIDEIYLGQFNSGMQPLGFTSSLALQLSADLANVPATRTENACASGSAAFLQGVKAVLAGTARNVLVIGAEKMTDAGADVVGAALLGASYEMAGKASSTGFTGLFAEVAKHYDKRYGAGITGPGVQGLGDVLGSIAAKNHRNGMDNPYAQMHRDFGEEFCRTISDKNPMVAEPLRRTDCSPVSDGAAAVVLSTSATVGATAPCAWPVSATRTISSPQNAAIPPNSPPPGRRGSAPSPWPGSALRGWTSPRFTTASPSPNSSCTRPWAWLPAVKDPGPSRRVGSTRTASSPSTSPAA